MMNRSMIVRISVAALGMLFVFVLPIPSAHGIGVCRDVDCDGPKVSNKVEKKAPKKESKKVPKEKDWKKCRKQDTIEGCCGHLGGKFSATGRTGASICCWNGTPKSSDGSTTTVGAEGGDIYQSDTQGRSCSDLMGK